MALMSRSIRSIRSTERCLLAMKIEGLPPVMSASYSTFDFCKQSKVPMQTVEHNTIPININREISTDIFAFDFL